MFKLLGFGWLTDVGLFGYLAAWEVFVSILGEVVAATNPDELLEALATITDDQWYREFTASTVIALLAYFNSPCSACRPLL
ncbi:hypothetical protein JK2ML_0472 [Mycobacterium leprae Kyoto-2]|uniref:Uncharacterized protein n=2 Tax=Mycobacterium leprae TaxID=1769 RepID=Q9CCT7_MYCLE|nr:hypothetical protein [Mycobacterium leprae]CAR70565.1 hypothetical protein MLBr00472 [Mycobacterium leprae Br4923]OAR20634.1 hypothetical protein A8144_10115 [Mycobacterium leprae 3125609]OAX70802.1 hypothetical protein A3216_09670 [Mycobacterium leprae 7935681]CAC29980.1 hypothetical protein [Mycobacterium leprae]BBC16580.1 hypothetical protein JK2ML_0472 [Mycobacterium leprae Kyoto-2]